MSAADNRPIGDPILELVLNKLMEVQQSQQQIVDRFDGLEQRLMGGLQPGEIQRIKTDIRTLFDRVGKIRKWDRTDLVGSAAVVSTVIYAIFHSALVLWNQFLHRGR